jgi:hypothetical protein
MRVSHCPLASATSADRHSVRSSIKDVERVRRFCALPVPARAC